MSIRDRVDRIRAFARSQGWPYYRLSKAAGLATGACYAMNDPGWNPRLETLMKLEALIPDDFDPAVLPSDGGADVSSEN